MDAALVKRVEEEACHQAKHTDSTMPASKQVDGERNVSLRGKTTGNIFPVLIEAKDLVDDDKTGKRPISLWTCQVSLEVARTGRKRSHVCCWCHNDFSPESNECPSPSLSLMYLSGRV